MIAIYDRAAMALVLDRQLDPALLALLKRLFASLMTPHGDLTDWTEFLVIEPGDSEADVVREMGFSPLVDPDGHRFRSPGFQPFWDHLDRIDRYAVLTITFGSTFAYVLIIEAADGTIPELRDLIRQHASTSRD